MSDKTGIIIIMKKTQEAVYQPPKTVDINGQQAILLVADLNEGQQLSVITTSLLERLVKLLPKAGVKSIVTEFADKLFNYAGSAGVKGKDLKIEEFVVMLQEELDFHKSVNMINGFFMMDLDKEPVKPETVGPWKVEEENY